MFRFIFRKKTTIFILISIIILSLIFSVLLNVPIPEGYENATINNPPPDIIEKVNSILNDNAKTELEKLSDIRSVLKNKYKILGDIYRQNESSILKELSMSLSIPPKRDSDGKLFDADALIGDNREKAIKLLSSNDYSAMEKIERIKELANNDKVINTILDEYVKAWFKMIKENIDRLKITANDVIPITPSP